MSRRRAQGRRRARGARQSGRARRPQAAAAPESTSALRRGLGAIHRRVMFEIDPFILGVYRAALGLLLLLYYLMLAPHWQMYYGPHGISIFHLSLDRFSPLAPLFLFVRSPALMWVIYATAIAAAVALAAGIWTRPAIVWLWIIGHSLLYANIYVVNGEEQVFALLLLFSLFLPLDRSFTLKQLCDPVRRRAMWLADEKVKVWALTAMQVHIVLIYLFSLPDKFADSAWRDGLVAYYALMAIDYPRWPGLSLAWGHAVLSRVLTYGTLAVEVAVPFLVWIRKWRVPCVIAALLLHLGLALLLSGVVMFNLSMMVALLTFLPSRRTRMWLASRLVRPEPGRAAAAAT